jgi:DNA-binding CsgD family transcriptional regulator/PAS domain-containing protein
MEEAGFSQALDAIYDAATEFERWPAALERLGDAFGASYVALLDRNVRTMQARASAIGLDPASQREFFDIWSERDVLRLRTRAYRAGAVETDHDILPRRDLLRSDYYNGFMKPHDMHVYMRMTLSVEDECRSIISFARPMSLGEYDTAEVEHCRRLVPHFQRAARVMQRVEESNLVLTAFSDMLEQSPTGVLLLSRNGKVLFANRAVRAMAQCADGFLLRGERIEVVNRQHQAALQRLIAGATGRPDRADVARGGVMRLPRKSGKPDFAMVAAPLANGTSWGESGPVAFILVTDPETTAMRPEATIRQLFGLSPAESRVAQRLMMGDSPEQAAAFLEVTIATARWHLASLYRKTGTSRQAQLVRLLMSAPMI